MSAALRVRIQTRQVDAIGVQKDISYSRGVVTRLTSSQVCRYAVMQQEAMAYARHVQTDYQQTTVTALPKNVILVARHVAQQAMLANAKYVQMDTIERQLMA